MLCVSTYGFELLIRHAVSGYSPQRVIRTGKVKSSHWVWRASKYCHLLPDTDMTITGANCGIGRLKSRPVLQRKCMRLANFSCPGYKDTPGKVSHLDMNFVLEDLLPPPTPVLQCVDAETLTCLLLMCLRRAKADAILTRTNERPFSAHSTE